MLNFAILMGRLTAAPEVKYSKTDKPYCAFTVAVERSFAGEDGERKTDFIDCIAWRNKAEFLERYFDKGSLVLLTGEMRQSKWVAEDGTNRSRVEFLVSDVSFTGERRERREDGREEAEAYDRQHTDAEAPPPRDVNELAKYGNLVQYEDYEEPRLDDLDGVW